jgi:hypothetical protein
MRMAAAPSSLRRRIRAEVVRRLGEQLEPTFDESKVWVR